MNPLLRVDLASQISHLSETMADRQTRFLADPIRIRSYTEQGKPAVDRTLAELCATGCDEVWQDSAGNALGCTRQTRCHRGVCRSSRFMLPFCLSRAANTPRGR
jgi:hypothetical protein